jgi:hypothetical protein
MVRGGRKIRFRPPKVRFHHPSTESLTNVPVRYVFSSQSNNNRTSQANTNGRRPSGCRPFSRAWRGRRSRRAGGGRTAELSLSKQNGPRRPSPKFPRAGTGLVCGCRDGCEQLADGGDERILQPLLPIRYRSTFSDKHWEPAKMKNSSCLFFRSGPFEMQFSLDQEPYSRWAGQAGSKRDDVKSGGHRRPLGDWGHYPGQVVARVWHQVQGHRNQDPQRACSSRPTAWSASGSPN